MRKLILRIFGIIVVGVFLLQSNVAIAASSLSEVDKQIKEKEEEIDGIQEEKSEALSEVEEQLSKFLNIKNK